MRCIKPRVSTAPSTRLTKAQVQGKPSDGMYDHRWRLARLRWLRANPLCVMCHKEGRITVATVVDHVIPHRGDPVKMWDESNWQSICAPHHNSDKQRIENKRRYM